MPNYAPRVSLSYADMSGVVEEWSTSCEKMVVYQHDPDEEVNRVHLHMVMINCKYKTAEALKRQFHSRVETALKGNALWSWEHKQDPDLSFITYMSKGILRPVFEKNVLPAEVEGYRLKWIEPTPKGKDLLTEKKESTKSKYDLLQEMISEVKHEEIVGKCYQYLTNYLVDVVCKVLRKNRIIIGRYKIREYRDAIFYYMFDTVGRKFTNFVNEDIKDDY